MTAQHLNPGARSADTQPAAPVAGVETTDDRASRSSMLARYGLSLGDGLVVGLAFLLCIAFGPTMSYPSWTPRFALVAAALPIGLVALIRGVRAGDRAARIALAAAVWIVIAGLGSGFPRSALLGFVARDMSALLVIGCIGVWAIARELTPRGRELLVPVVLAGLGFNLLVAAMQLAFDVQAGPFAMNGGRPSGLSTNPVYFGGLMGGAAALCAVSVLAGHRGGLPVVGRRRQRLVTLTLTVGFAGGTSLSGSRVAVLALALLCCVLLIVRGRQALPPVAATALGVLLGTAALQLAGSSADALSRAAESGGGLDGRRQAWRFAIEAIQEKPIFGWGFGRFQPSIQQHYTADFVRQYATQDLGVAWFDAHNVVIGVVDAVGVVGFLVLLVWVLMAARGADKTLLAFPMTLAATWLLQPPALATLPLAALMLGAATTPIQHVDLKAGRVRRPEFLDRSAVAVGLLACVYLVVIDVTFYVVTDELDGRRSEFVAGGYPGDPVVAGLVAQVWALDTRSNVSEQAIAWQERAVKRDPERPYWRARLAERYLLAGRYDEAWAQTDKALGLQPFHPDSLRLRIAIAARMNDEGRLQRALQEACEIEASACELDTEKLLDAVDSS